MVDLTIEPFSLALDRPLETAHGTITHREGVLVRVERNGVVGIGEATPLPGWTESLRACRAALDRAASSSNPSNAALDNAFDSCPAARHGFTLALADMRARQAGQPLYRSLGGTERVTSIPVNATIGDGSIEETVGVAANAVDQGYACLKCKVGVRSVETDVQRLRAVRETVGSEIELRADANGAWNREQAVRAFEAFAAEDVAVSYVEQPLSPGDIEGHADLREMDGVGVALDESLAETAVETILSAGAADALILKPMVLGGIDRVHETAMRARTADIDRDSTTATATATTTGVTPVVTTTIDGAYARAGAVHAAASVPGIAACGLATGDRLAEDFMKTTAVTEGRIAVPQGNGNIARRTGTTDA